MILNIAVLGLGEGRSTISASLASEKLNLVKICDRNEELCRQRANEFHFDAYTTKYDDLLNDPDIDIIAIYTPDHLHAGHIRQALIHGKHVVCTKPFIHDLSHARELIELSEKNNRKVFVGQSSRFFEPMKRQRTDFEKGVIGDLITVEAFYNADHRWFLNKDWSLKSEFKWLYGGLSHPVDFIRWYLPEIEEVVGYGMLSQNGVKAGLKNEDTMHFIFRAKDGRIARVSGIYTSPVQPAMRESEMSCILRGTEGASQADYHELRYSVTTREGEEKIITWGEDFKNYYFRFEGQSHHAGEYQNYLEYFADSIEQNFTAYPDIREGIGTVALLQAMDRSLQTGEKIKIDDILKEYNINL
ncbi:oxidoreductase domain-containing protein [Proteiniphilum saccharofermentans]|uniref:Oxidoreductase domain-containing protein n=1 Tax=Proteiniphilum saccharofermentans TaxID=1642647 RepID=A0A1R3T2Y1_9BACT|nr:Gfo/Idh/MocA family oxidoreductase [Proteiniphilum saccharofermentans]SCD21490.1 oxidoreductase domain-containing protein [Proteiniphilum saccharofermentans]SDZ84139.1 Predicted dehydrogenase [Porphyromonadaceae bacterium KH3R12]SFS71083.1 Predicted dehydrogenase [Porphyromonadaceae bacterium NLAE-zl-C104]SFU55945.1 Predicted dehydrogenase [Porphyromonadaceae bacterium KHP3R9]